MRTAFLAAAFAAALVPASAQAFCGFYVGGGGAKLFNNATQVVLMREGTKTVLSMQNNYQGPAENFAMVIPVPVVLKKEDVKTLSNDIFSRVDQLDSPRLVEYWEQDPCAPLIEYEKKYSKGTGIPKRPSAKPSDDSLGVKIEAQFTVAEYEIVVLSAKESTGLDTWLRSNKYNIPEGAEPVLKPYVESGMKFFVAKVDPKKVTFDGNQAMLSPLRFAYDSENFSLPVRLGLLNAGEAQDLIVHILAKDRYETSNYKNVTIPTNINVAEGVKDEFGSFYVSLFDETLKKNPGAVVTEYAWQASSCDPCPGPGPLSAADTLSLGGDIAFKSQNTEEMAWNPQGQLTLTRLHARYSKETLGEDLVFQKADPIVGGREFLQENGKLEESSRKDSSNNFQGRYIIRHPWTGPIECQNPKRGIWGGPGGSANNPTPAPKPSAARNLAFAKRGVELASLVRQDIPEIGLKLGENAAAPGDKAAPGEAAPGSQATTTPTVPATSTPQSSCSTQPAGGSAGAGLLALFGLLWWRRRARHSASR